MNKSYMITGIVVLVFLVWTGAYFVKSLTAGKPAPGKKSVAVQKSKQEQQDKRDVRKRTDSATPTKRNTGKRLSKKDLAAQKRTLKKGISGIALHTGILGSLPFGNAMYVLPAGVPPIFFKDLSELFISREPEPEPEDEDIEERELSNIEKLFDSLKDVIDANYKKYIKKYNLEKLVRENPSVAQLIRQQVLKDILAKLNISDINLNLDDVLGGIPDNFDIPSYRGPNLDPDQNPLEDPFLQDYFNDREIYVDEGMYDDPRPDISPQPTKEFPDFPDAFAPGLDGDESHGDTADTTKPAQKKPKPIDLKDFPVDKKIQPEPKPAPEPKPEPPQE